MAGSVQTPQLTTFEGTIFGHEVRSILVDSGCTQSQVAARWLPPEVPHQGEVTVQGVHATQQMPIARAAIRLHGRSVQPMVAINSNMHFDAILGIDVENVLALLGSDHLWVPNSPTPEDSTPQLTLVAQQPPASPSTSEQSQDSEASPVSDYEDDEHLSSASSSTSQASAPTKRRRTRRKRRPRRCAKDPNYVDPSSSSSASAPQSEDSEQEQSSDAEAPSSTKSQSESQVEDSQDTKQKNTLGGGRSQLLKAQASDRSLDGCRSKAKDNRGDLFLKDGLVFRRWTQPHHQDELHQVVLPRSYRETAMQMAHFLPFAGHFGKRKTTHRVMSIFFWPGMRREIQQMCRSCEVCQKTDRRRKQWP